jgi:hypothetical protein
MLLLALMPTLVDKRVLFSADINCVEKSFQKEVSGKTEVGKSGSLKEGEETSENISQEQLAQNITMQANTALKTSLH